MLSILEREMRVAARRPWTFRVRVLTMLGAFFLGALMVATGDPGRGAGAWIFKMLTFIAFWICLLDGVRRASGSIADEKRDGTLGLLFLTDLRPVEIVAGKMFSSVIPVIQPLLAFAPVLSICLLLGGVTGGEIARAMLVMAAAIIFSTSIGLFVSSVSRKAQETGNKTAMLLLFAVLTPRMFHGRWDEFKRLTPLTAYKAIPDPGFRHFAADYWWSLALTILLSVIALWGAAYFLPRRWNEDKSPAAPSPKNSQAGKARARYLEGNPADWLAARYAMSRKQKFIFNLALLAFAIFAAFAAHENQQGGVAFLPLGIGAVIFLLRVASQASYPLAEARRSGALEMILSTPLPPDAFVEGQKHALRRQFLPSLALLIFAAFVCPLFGSGRGEIIVLTAWYLGFLIIGAGTFAYVGMWMGLKKKNPNSAFFNTAALLIFAPLLGICLASVFAWPLVWVVLWAVASVKISGASLRQS